MSLNIKNPRVHELARRAAGLTGRSQTSVIEEALERYLSEMAAPDARETRATRVDEVLGQVRAVLREDTTDPHVAIDALYDPATGLPR